MWKWHLIIVYLGINVPICLKHCAIGPYLWTYILLTNIWTTQNMQHSLSLLSISGRPNEGSSPSRYFFFLPLLSLILSSLHPSLLFLSSLLKIEEEDQKLGFWRSLSLQGFKNKEWEDQAWCIGALTSLSLWVSLTLGGFLFLVNLSFQEQGKEIYITPCFDFYS